VVIDQPEQEPAYNWMSPIKEFLDNQPPSHDNAKVERIARKSKMYHLIDRGILSMSRQRYDDEVYPQKRRHPIASGYSQHCIRITLIIVLYHRQSL
jgi:hypothetical protein